MYYQAELYPALRNTDYDWYWERVYLVSGSILYFGIETKYFVCEAHGAQKLNSGPYQFYTDREIVIGNDTIVPGTNLLAEKKSAGHILLKKNETGSFYSEPQYVLQLDNNALKLNAFYTFYFKGYTVGGAEIFDSTIVFVD